MHYQIKIASKDHVTQIAEITHHEARRSFASVAWQDEPLERWHQNWEKQHELYPWLVAIDGSKPTESEVVAYARASPYNPREGFKWSVTLSVYVKPEYQQQRIAFYLYQKLFQMLNYQGYINVYARISLPNEGSRKLHEQFGLTQTGLLPHFAYKHKQWLNMGLFTGFVNQEVRDINDLDEPQEIIDVHEAYESLYAIKT